MSATISMEVNPFPVPSEVTIRQPTRLRQEGMVRPMTLQLKEIPYETLDQMCKDFRAEVMLRAGHSNREAPDVAADAGS